MNKYYLHNGSENIGPFNLEELKSKKITKTTQVWYEGLVDWKNAGEVDELNSILSSVPPPIKSFATAAPSQKIKEIPDAKKSSWGKIILKSIVVTILIIVTVGFIANYSSRDSDTASYEESVMTIADVESSTPMEFLNADGKYHRTLLGDQISINGQSQNKATVTTYKDVVIEVIFYSKTNSEVGREQFTIYDFFEPNSKKDFKLKVKNYSNVETIGWDVANAIVK
jgi:hypothetical protein